MLSRLPLALAFLGALAFPQSAPKFEVASVKLNKSADPPYSNFPLGPGEVYVRNGGLFAATGWPLELYIGFAYKLLGNQSAPLSQQLPDWARTEHYDIQARAQTDPGKDGMRLMMRELLADRFKLVTHYDTREEPVLAYVLVKAGKTGPQLKPHANGAPCPTEPPTSASPGVIDGLPAYCNGIYPLPPSVPGHFRFGGRNVTIQFIADTLAPGTATGRPMIDQTGLTGTFDFSVEFVMPPRGPAPPEGTAGTDLAGPTFEQALREQLGIKLQSQKGPVKVLMIDHVERPSAN